MQKLVIFDCDGVLIDSEVIANTFTVEALTKAGYPITLEECIRKFTGLNTQSVQQLIFKESGIEISLKYLSNHYQKAIDAFEFRLQPLLFQILSSLEEMGVSRCVATGGGKERVRRCLELTNQLPYFNDSIFSSQEVVKGKPAPDIFLHAAKKMGFSENQCIVIEDSPAGIEAALSAKMNVIGFLGGSHAKYSWYEERIRKYDIPYVKKEDDLLARLAAFISPSISLPTR